MLPPRATLSLRLWARLIDALWTVPGGLLLWRSLSALTDLSWEWQMAAFAIFTSALQLALEPIFVSFFGATPGKALVGLAVIDTTTGRSLTYAAALGRTVKVVALGLGFWLLPLTLIALLATLWRQQRSARGIPWDRDSIDGRVIPLPSRRVRRGLWMLALASVPGWLVISAAFMVALVLITAKDIDTGQDIGRTLTGRWVWLHRLSGEMMTLDARWRVLNDMLTLRGGEWNAVFAFGEGESNRVLLDVRIKRPILSSPCLSKRLFMEDEGFVFLNETDLDAENCSATGGKPSAAGVVLVRIDGHRSTAGDHTLTQTYLRHDGQAREAVSALAARLAAERGKQHIRNHVLDSHYWRNEITGAVARIPGDWELTERTANTNGSVLFMFERASRGVAKEQMAFVAYSWTYFDVNVDPHDSLESALFQNLNVVNATRRVLNRQETLAWGSNERSMVHLWTRRDRFSTWAAFWDANTPNSQPDATRQHPLLRELYRTLP